MRLLHQRLRTDERARRTASKRTRATSFMSFSTGLVFSVVVSVLAVQGVQLSEAIGDPDSGFFPAALFVALGLVGLGSAVASLWLWLRRREIERAVIEAELDAHRGLSEAKSNDDDLALRPENHRAKRAVRAS